MVGSSGLRRSREEKKGEKKNSEKEMNSALAEKGKEKANYLLIRKR